MLGEVVFLVGELLLFFTQQVVLHAQIFLDARTPPIYSP